MAIDVINRFFLLDQLLKHRNKPIIGEDQDERYIFANSHLTNNQLMLDLVAPLRLRILLPSSRSGYHVFDVLHSSCAQSALTEFALLQNYRFCNLDKVCQSITHAKPHLQYRGTV